MLNRTRTINAKQLFLLVALGLISVIVAITGLEGLSYMQLSLVVLLDIAVCALLFVRAGQAKLDNACFLFWAITTLFSFGQNIAYLFISNKVHEYDALLYQNVYSLSRMLKGTCFTILAYNVFTVALIPHTKKHGLTERKNTMPEEERSQIARAAVLVGNLLVMVSIVPHILYMYEELKLFFEMGYGNTARGDLPGFVQVLQYWFIPGIIISYIGKLIRGQGLAFENTMLLATALTFMMTGDRGYALALLLVLLWLRSLGKLGKKRTVYIWAVVIILLIPLVRYFRTAFTSGTGNALQTAFEAMINTNPLVEMLLELGGSQQIIIMTMEKVAKEGFAYGTAYLDFLVKMLPSFLGIGTSYGTLAKWVINTTAYQTQGFSIWAEGYLNFGMLGIPFMYVLGRAFRGLLAAKSSSSPYRIMLTAISLYFFADVARRSVSEFGYNFLYNILLPIGIVYVVTNLLRNRQNNRV